MNEPRAGRPGAAAFALLAILAITAGWWMLALWPAGAVAPEWLVRTRAACFGAVRGGLPDTGGWILLIGQPLGMLGLLLAVWGDALRAELRRMRADRRWRLAAVGGAALTLLGTWSVGRRVALATALGSAQRMTAAGTLTKIDVDASGIVLSDQFGHRTAFTELPGREALLTFAFGHCATVCPTLVHDIRAARLAANRPEVPLVVVTLDPWRDTPERLPALAAQWGLAPEDRLLSGSIAEVERTLDLLGIGRRRDESTGDIAHGGTVMLLDERGHLVWRLDAGWGRVRELLARGPEPSR